MRGENHEGDLRRAIKKARWRRPISRILSRLGYAPKRGRSFLWGSSCLEPQATYPQTSAGPAGCRPPKRETTGVFLLGLASSDAYHAGDVAIPAVGSYPAVSPLPDP